MRHWPFGLSSVQSSSVSANMDFAHLHTKRFVEAFLKSLGVIGASEIGDKTFFIAAIMAMRNPRWTVFAGALGALALMTVLSAILGWAAPNLIPKVYTHYAATLLFFFFGFKTLYDVLIKPQSDEEESELQQVEHELSSDKETGNKQRAGLARLAGMLFSPVFLNAFTLTFLAEWGDRSQIATIGLAASQDVVGVTLGSILGHAACTAVAVIGGKHLAAHIDERTVGIVGGVLFIVFGLHGLISSPE